MSTGAIALFSLVMLLLLIFCGVHLSTSLMFTSTAVSYTHLRKPQTKDSPVQKATEISCR